MTLCHSVEISESPGQGRKALNIPIHDTIITTSSKLKYKRRLFRMESEEAGSVVSELQPPHLQCLHLRATFAPADGGHSTAFLLSAGCGINVNDFEFAAYILV